MVSTPKPRSTAPTPATSPDSVASSATEAKILAAAREEFVEKGSSGARMQAIADRAGVNKALLHYYFRSKQKLYESVLNSIMSTMLTSLKQNLGVVRDDSDIRGLIRTVVTTYTTVLRENPAFPVIMIREFADGGANLPKIVAGLIESFGDVPKRVFTSIVLGVKSGRLRPIDPPQVFMNIMGMSLAAFLLRPIVSAFSQGITGEAIVYDDAFFAQRIDAIVTMACDGLVVGERASL